MSPQHFLGLGGADAARPRGGGLGAVFCLPGRASAGHSPALRPLRGSLCPGTPPLLDTQVLWGHVSPPFPTGAPPTHPVPVQLGAQGVWVKGVQSRKAEGHPAARGSAGPLSDGRGWGVYTARLPPLGGIRLLFQATRGVGRAPSLVSEHQPAARSLCPRPALPAWGRLPHERLASLWGPFAGLGAASWVPPAPCCPRGVPSGVSLPGLSGSAWSVLLAAWAGGGVAGVGRGAGAGWRPLISRWCRAGPGSGASLAGAPARPWQSGLPVVREDPGLGAERLASWEAGPTWGPQGPGDSPREGAWGGGGASHTRV